MKSFGRAVASAAAVILLHGVLAPLGLVLRLLGRGELRLRLDRGTSTYWVERRPSGTAARSRGEWRQSTPDALRLFAKERKAWLLPVVAAMAGVGWFFRLAPPPERSPFIYSLY